MQDHVTISTSESTLEIKRGLFNIREEREAAFTSVKYIYADCCDLKNSYFRLGFHLNEFKSCEYYHDFGFLSFEEFCEANIGLDKSAISRCMNVADRFCMRNTGCLLPTMFLDERFAGYSYSQLCEMLPLKEEELSEINPGMTIKQIRDFKKDKKASAKNESVSSCDVATDDERKFVYEDFFQKNGVMEQQYIKKCSRKGFSRLLYLFDQDGKRIEANVWVDVLAIKNDKIILRKC